MKRFVKSKIPVTLLLVITILVLYVSLKDDFYEIVKQLFSIHLLWLLLSVLLVLLHWFFKASVIHQFARAFAPKYPMKKAFRMELGTRFFNGITPFSTGGQPYQIYALRKDGFQTFQATTIVMQVFITFQIALLLIGFIAVISNFYFHFLKETPVIGQLVIVGFIYNFFVLFLLFLLAFYEKMNQWVAIPCIRFLVKIRVLKNKEEALAKVEKIVHDFHLASKTLFFNQRLFWSMIFINLISLIVLYAVPLFLLYGLGDYQSLHLMSTVIATSYVMLIASFVPTPGGSGGVEYSFVKLFGVVVSGSALAALMILWRFLTYYLGIVVGAIVFHTSKRK